MNEKNKEIYVCSCGSPLIFTFVFAYSEYLCLECGKTYEMMGVDSVEATPELKHKKMLYKKLWNIICTTGGFLPRSRYAQKNCKKCIGDNHKEHLSDIEIMKDKVATNIFKRLITPQR